MASALLRTSVRRGRTFGRFVSTARSGGDALAARPVSLRCYPLRPLSNSSTSGDQLPKGPSPDEKVDQMLRVIEELDQLVERDVAELVELYKAYQIA